MGTNTDIIISVKDLVKEYNHGDVVALDHCDLEVKKGEVVAIIGPSGSGKSTLLRSLNLLEEPTAGEIYFEGVELSSKKVDINRHRQKMGMVFQHFNLFPHKTVLENIMMAPVTLKLKTPREAQAQALKLLERVGLADKKTNIQTCFPADSSSVSRSCVRWRWSRRSCSLTNRHPRSTRRWSARYWMSCGNWRVTV